MKDNKVFTLVDKIPDDVRDYFWINNMLGMLAHFPTKVAVVSVKNSGTNGARLQQIISNRARRRRLRVATRSKGDKLFVFLREK